MGHEPHAVAVLVSVGQAAGAPPWAGGVVSVPSGVSVTVSVLSTILSVVEVTVISSVAVDVTVT